MANGIALCARGETTAPVKRLIRNAVVGARRDTHKHTHADSHSIASIN